MPTIIWLPPGYQYIQKNLPQKRQDRVAGTQSQHQQKGHLRGIKSAVVDRFCFTLSVTMGAIMWPGEQDADDDARMQQHLVCGYKNDRQFFVGAWLQAYFVTYIGQQASGEEYKHPQPV